jgi:diaminopimelate dehydrogenase
MSTAIKIGIAGYGNLGRGVELAIAQNSDMVLTGIFTRRDPASVQPQDSTVPVRPLASVADYKSDIDVLVLCGGSKNDLPEQGPALAALFNIVDSFDTHAKIPDYFAAVDKAAAAARTTALISVGWDPGLFSLNRLYGEAILPKGETYTFWGKGLSQGHSDALRRVPGVKAAVQYTLPVADAVERVRSGAQPALTTREKHTRDCYVVLDAHADANEVKQAIVTMPDYFADYDTSVNFITEEALRRDHGAMPHGGFVIRSGTTGEGTRQVVEYSLTLDSNPEFTSSVLVAYARAVFRLSQAGSTGAKTVFDVPPGMLSAKEPSELRAGLL